MLILFLADLHITLRSKKVPKQWAKDRIRLLTTNIVQAASTHKVDKIIIGGDLLDRNDPTTEELELLFDFIWGIPPSTKIVIYSGNHCMLNKKVSCLDYLADTIARINPLASVITEAHYRSEHYDVINYSAIHSTKAWPQAQAKIAFTHVRGAIPPHVKPEIRLYRFTPWDTVFAGDLHSHTNSQSNIVYPGSPYTTSFHRNEVTGSNGYIIVDTDNPLAWEWHELKLPQLIRKTVSRPEDMIKTDFHHTVYELHGDAVTLANVSSDVLDKKITKVEESEATLDLVGKTEEEELVSYLTEVEQLGTDSVSGVITKYREIAGD